MGAVAPDRSAERRAPVVAAELVHLVARVVRGHAARGVERRPRQPGGQLIVAPEEDDGAGEFVGAAPGDHVHGAAAGAAGLGRVPARDHLELLDGFLGDEGAAALPRQPAPPEAEERALRVGAVDGESRVHGALPAEREPAAGIHLHGRHQEGEAHEVAARDRQVGDLFLVHIPGDPGAPHFEERRLSDDHDGLFDRGETELQVQLEALPDEEADVLPAGRAEAGQRRHEVVHAGGDRAQGEEALPVRDHRAALAALEVHELDRHARQAGAGRVADETLHRRERLGPGRRGHGEGEEADGGGQRRPPPPMMLECAMQDHAGARVAADLSGLLTDSRSLPAARTPRSCCSRRAPPDPARRWPGGCPRRPPAPRGTGARRRGR